MTTSQNTSPIRKLERLNIREVWSNESQDFTPWLAENLDELGDTLGIELELDDIEVPVGRYSLDILAVDARGGAPVAIENQIESANHSHLGQLLTYAAGIGAQTMVWVATEFTNEHRSALAWLNEYTAEEMRFFGIVVEVVRIGDSDPAPLLQVVAAPPEWSRETPYKPDAQLSPLAMQYVRFWEPLLENLNARHRWNVITKNPRSSYSAGSGFSYINRVMRFTWDREARVELVIRSVDGDWNKTVYEALLERKEDIENSLGTELTWERLDSAKSSRVAVCRSGSIDDSDAELTETRTWMTDYVIRFREVFQPHLGEIIRDISG